MRLTHFWAFLQIAEEKEAEAARAQSNSSRDKDVDRVESSKDDQKGGKAPDKTSSSGMANGTSEKVWYAHTTC